ncbi:hypothetical protein E5161_00965 [Cohnella pontilimi]|uniref:Thioesterase domain-containing protein n=1 Tax=Cohnella pontilimi TaxID=2564100 RepID=A0A4U0FGJ9_9BACL|nr:hypothetical protein [Cohnella pontilimi]TJY44000.1 hypothetical protein E5161_00965 [Cohnella pontilimi]
MSELNLATEWDIYLLAGVGSSRSIFAACKRELQQRFQEEGRDPVIRELFPYGDHSVRLIRQVMEVGADLAGLRGLLRSGGRDAAEQVRTLSAGRPVLFIGHSGGSVAAYQAAVKLSEEGVIPDFRVVQVGSPKVPIRPEHRRKVSYFVAVDDQGHRVDPITRLGRWGGWARNRLGVRYWDKMKYAPGLIGSITVLGGHEHYFRNDDRYIHPERGSNLSLTLDSIWERVADYAEQVT